MIPPIVRGRLCFIGGGVGEHFAGWQNALRAVLTYLAMNSCYGNAGKTTVSSFSVALRNSRMISGSAVTLSG